MTRHDISLRGTWSTCSRFAFGVIVAVALVLATDSIGAADVSVSPSALLASPYSYDGKHVAVPGIVRDVEEKISHAGNAYDVFDICDTRCVRVFTWGHPAISAGEKLTVHGTFSMTKHVGVYTFHNEIEADESSL